MKTTYKILITAGLLLIAVGQLSLNAAVPEGWSSDLKASNEKAKKDDKNVLLMFTGSDWCIWCHRLRDEILNTKEFKDWSAENIVLVYLDFPRKDYRSPEVIEQNKRLADKYGIRGYPTVIIADSSGKEVARLGYMQGGPKTFIRAIEKATH